MNYLATSAQGTTAGGSKSWQRDATLPVIDGSLTGTNGSNGWFISSAEITASVTESGSGLSAFETSLDNTNWTAYTTPLTFNDGVYTLNIRAIDVAGNIAIVDLPISVDTVSPTVGGTLSGTMGSANWYNSIVQASSTASDATSGIATFESSSSGGAWTAYTVPIIFEDGIHTVIFKVVDVAGNSSETALYSFKVDTSAPHISLPSRWYIWESITFEASEKTSGFTDIEMQIMDSQGRWKKIEKHWSTDQDSFTYTILWNRAFADGILAPIGNYPVVVRAWDEAGNMSEKSGQIIIPQPDAAPLPTFTPTPVQEVLAVETEESEDTQEIAALIEPEPAPVEEERPEEKKESIFTFGSKTNTPTPNSQSTNANVLWGATASAAIGAFAAQIAERKRREAEAEAARKRAEREYQKRVWAAGAGRYNQAKRVKAQAAKSSWIAQQTSQWFAEYNKKPEEDPYDDIGEWHERQDSANAAVIAEYKAIREKKRKESMREKVLGFKEKLLNPPAPKVPDEKDPLAEYIEAEKWRDEHSLEAIEHGHQPWTSLPPTYSISKHELQQSLSDWKLGDLRTTIIPIPTRAPIAPAAAISTPIPPSIRCDASPQLATPVPEFPSVLQENKRTLWDTVQANSEKIQHTIPSIGLTSERIPVPVFSIPNVFSFGAVTSQQSALDGNPVLRFNKDGGAIVGKTKKVSGFVGINTSKKSMSYGIRYSGPNTVKENGFSANSGYSAITTVKLNQIWNASASLDINVTDVSVREEGVAKGNIRSGAYFEANMGTPILALATVAVVVNAPWEVVIGGAAKLIDILLGQPQPQLP